MFDGSRLYGARADENVHINLSDRDPGRVSEEQ